MPFRALNWVSAHTALLLFASAMSTVMGADAAAVVPPGDKLTTRSGDHLTGQIVGLDCHGLKFRYYGNILQVPFDKLAAASSAAEVTVFAGIGNDRLTGRILVSAATVYVWTRDFGKVALPIAAMQCDNSAGAEAVDVGKRGASSRIPAGGTQLSGTAMALLSGEGGEPAEQHGGDQSPPSPNGSATAQKSSAGNPQPASSAPPVTKEEEEETERNVLEFLRAEAVVVQPGKVEGDFSLSYLHTSQLLGNEKVGGFNSTVRMGITRDLEGFIAVPVVWGQRQTTELNSVISNDLGGIGDLRFGLKYVTLNEGPGIPEVVFGISASAPIGRPPYLAPFPGAIVAGDTRDPLNIQIGTGHWMLTGSATAFKSYDPLLLYTTINYTHFIPATYYSVRIAPGDVWGLNSGFGFSVNDTNTLSAQLFIDYEERWQFNGVPVSQTNITPIALKLSFVHVLSPRDLIQPSVLFGLTRDATDAVVQLDYIHRF